MTTEDNFVIKLVLSNWDSQHKRTQKLLTSLSDEQLRADIAPGRNSGQYILGHLIAVDDYLFPILGFGERLYPELEPIFLTNPDKSGLTMPSISNLRLYWQEVEQQLNQRFAELDTNAWLDRHTTVSEADFAREPHRNKLNVVLNRTTHLSYHLGQLMLLNHSS